VDGLDDADPGSPSGSGGGGGGGHHDGSAGLSEGHWLSIALDFMFLYRTELFS
jgi:hypothetical protein